jgi:integrase
LSPPVGGERIYTNTFIRIVGDLPLHAVSSTILERWRFGRLKDVKPVTYNDERRALSHIFNKAVEAGHLQSNPFKRLKRMKEQQHRLYMTSDELEKFFKRLDLSVATARNRNHRAVHKKFKQFCEVLLNTGMRRSELLRLRLEDVDFDNNVVRVEKTKGKKRREIPMTARVREILKEVSPGLFAEMSGDQVSHKFTACAKSIGLKGLKLHSFRHTFGTLLLAMGYDITVAKELLGHEDIKTTLVYAKADQRLLRDAIRSFEIVGGNGYKMVTETGGG